MNRIDPTDKGMSLLTGKWVGGEKYHAYYREYKDDKESLVMSLFIQVYKPDGSFETYLVNPLSICRNTTSKLKTAIIWEHDLFQTPNGGYFEVRWDENSLQWVVWRPTQTIPLYQALNWGYHRIGNAFENPSLYADIQINNWKRGAE